MFDKKTTKSRSTCQGLQSSLLFPVEIGKKEILEKEIHNGAKGIKKKEESSKVSFPLNF
jgi:hypothetical protein